MYRGAFPLCNCQSSIRKRLFWCPERFIFVVENRKCHNHINIITHPVTIEQDSIYIHNIKNVLGILVM